MNISPGFQVRHSEVVVGSNVFAQFLSGLFAEQHCQLRQTVGHLEYQETHRHTSGGQIIDMFFKPVETISLRVISICK